MEKMIITDNEKKQLYKLFYLIKYSLAHDKGLKYKQSFQFLSHLHKVNVNDFNFNDYFISEVNENVNS